MHGAAVSTAVPHPQPQLQLYLQRQRQRTRSSSSNEAVLHLANFSLALLSPSSPSNPTPSILPPALTTHNQDRKPNSTQPQQRQRQQAPA